ncbi:hypothetical protein [Paraburkholderia tropica]|uniref:hypothetical protein n=1 Tax=Paraburkholderia tropica TaxID=92647 RepID=UPI003D2C6516
MKKFIAVIAIPLLLAACGQKLSGTYTDANKIGKLTFESGNKVLVGGGFGPELELTYEVDGSKLKITSPEGTQVFTINDDGSIQGPTGKLKKQSN